MLRQTNENDDGGKEMKTKRISVGLEQRDYDIIKGRAAEARLTMSGFIRNLVLAERRQQYISTQNPVARERPWVKPKRRLPLIPGTPEYEAGINTQNMQEVVVELKQILAERRAMIEEEMLREVEIK